MPSHVLRPLHRKGFQACKSLSFFMQNPSIFTCIETCYWCLKKNKNVYWKHVQGNTQIRLRDKTSHINLAFISKTTPHTPLSWLFFIFIFHELSTQPSIQHGSPTLSFSLKFLESLWVVGKWLNWYWIVIGALLEFSLYSILHLLFFSSISSFLCEFQYLLLVPLKCSWYHMFRWYL